MGFCSVDKKISLRFQQDFPYRIVFSAVLDSKSADTKAETLSTGQKCKDKQTCHLWVGGVARVRPLLSQCSRSPIGGW